MIKLSWWEKTLTVVIQVMLWVLYPWQTTSRWDTVLCLVTLGVMAVVILGCAEWLFEHVTKKEIPG